jgi:hypothetical protein
VDARVNASYENLNRGISWISNADNKALIGLAFQGAILAGLAAAGDGLRVAIEHQRSECLVIVELVLLGGFTLALSWSLWKFFRSLFPRVTARDRSEAAQSPFFFGTIGAMPLAAFRERMRGLNALAIEEELIKQTHVVADIASRKFRNLQLAYIWLAPELLLLAGSVILAQAGQRG